MRHRKKSRSECSAETSQLQQCVVALEREWGSHASRNRFPRCNPVERSRLLRNSPVIRLPMQNLLRDTEAVRCQDGHGRFQVESNHGRCATSFAILPIQGN